MATKGPGLAAAEEEAIIRSRVLTQTSVSKGEAPLKRLTKRYLDLCHDAESGTAESTEDKLKHFLREVALLEVQAQKLNAVCSANKREQEHYVQKQQQLEQEIEQAKLDIEAKKLELKEARVQKQHNEEYEVLRHVVVEQPSRTTTQEEINRIKKSIEKITQEGNKIALTMQKRRKQFALLFNVIEELQRMEDDTADNQPADADTAMDVDG